MILHILNYVVKISFSNTFFLTCVTFKSFAFSLQFLSKTKIKITKHKKSKNRKTKINKKILGDTFLLFMVISDWCLSTSDKRCVTSHYYYDSSAFFCATPYIIITHWKNPSSRGVGEITATIIWKTALLTLVDRNCKLLHGPEWIFHYYCPCRLHETLKGRHVMEHFILSTVKWFIKANWCVNVI